MRCRPSTKNRVRQCSDLVEDALQETRRRNVGLAERSSVHIRYQYLVESAYTVNQVLPVYAIRRYCCHCLYDHNVVAAAIKATTTVWNVAGRV